MCTAADLVIWVFVDMEKSRALAIAFSIEQGGLNAEMRVQQALTPNGDGAQDY
ncbi:MAG: hypothetical protein TREMPRED_003344 [Tremellales sp. Tagirdzhanova-0007]|nr:MAG: hypothetical protein TREMPRED_003344 [Tremellales sp. Tagirdzhanova-0007]